MRIINEMRLDFKATPENEAFARLAISGFMLPLDPPWRSWPMSRQPCQRR